MSSTQPSYGESPVTTWRQEANAMADASIVVRRIGLSLPPESGTRAAFLNQAQRYATAARIRGVESPVEADLGVELAAAELLAAERVLAAVA
jgi:hypothetical protein